jgi:hypothetical protein
LLLPLWSLNQKPKLSLSTSMLQPFFLPLFSFCVYLLFFLVCLIIMQMWLCWFQRSGDFCLWCRTGRVCARTDSELSLSVACKAKERLSKTEPREQCRSTSEQQVGAVVCSIGVSFPTSGHNERDALHRGQNAEKDGRLAASTVFSITHLCGGASCPPGM